MGHEGRGRPFAVALRWGFGTALLLAAAAGIVSIVEVQRARHEVRSRVRTAARSTFLLDQIGRHVSRLRAIAFDQLIEPERDDTIEDDELVAVVGALDASMREIEPLLQPNEIRA